MEKKSNLGLNDYSNNPVRFCRVIKPYITLCYAIKHNDISFLRHVLWEVVVIFQVPAAKKPKYINALLKQIYIIDTTVVDPIL